MRRSLRVQDNLPLWTAVSESEQVIPIVFLSTEGRYQADTPRRVFVRAALADLRNNLEAAGSSLVVRHGRAVDDLANVAAEWGVQAVYAVEVFDRTTLQKDSRIHKELRARGIAWYVLPDTLLQQPGEVLTGAGQPYKVFTPFKRAWLAGSGRIPGVLPQLSTLPAVPRTIHADPFPWSGDPGPGGETAALRRWKQFLKEVLPAYGKLRDLPGVDGTSRMSAFLAHGAISIRRLYHDVEKERQRSITTVRANIDVFLSELIWREFYYHIAARFPFVVDRAFREELAGIRWKNSRTAFQAWSEGRTGYPIVDAALRQLAREGWVHNRARMIAASFLTKDLHIDWKWGERLFLEHLVDADIASNNGGWQWTAGTGTDASPWFRIFNPVTQGKRFDPSGTYVRTFVPELAAVPQRHIHAPWLMPRELQREIGVMIGRDYPAPIVDHAEARRTTLALYREPEAFRRR